MWSSASRLPPAGSCNNTCPTEGTRTEREWKLLQTEHNTRTSLCLQTEFRTLPRREEIDSMSWLVQSHEVLLFPSQVVIARSGQPVEEAAGTRRDRSPFSTARTKQSEPAELAVFHVGSPVNYCVFNLPRKYILQTEISEMVSKLSCHNYSVRTANLVDNFGRISLGCNCGNFWQGKGDFVPVIKGHAVKAHGRVEA